MKRKHEMGFWRKLRQWASPVDAISNPLSVTRKTTKKLEQQIFDQLNISAHEQSSKILQKRLKILPCKRS